MVPVSRIMVHLHYKQRIHKSQSHVIQNLMADYDFTGNLQLCHFDRNLTVI